MAKRGPKPAATPEPRPDGGPLWEGYGPPADLTDAGRREFDRLVSALAHAGTLDRTDPQLVASAARTHDLIERAAAEIGSGALAFPSSNGTMMPHPLLSVLNTLTMRSKTLLAEMGLTPRGRGGSAKAADDANPWGDLLGVAG